MSLTLEQAIARVPMWKDAREVKTSPLGGGITNQNFRVEVNGEAFVLRIGGEDVELLGIDRRNEYAANVAAARIGIAPEVVYFIEPEGYLITRFLNARPLAREEISKPENIRRIAQVLKQIHALPPVPSAFSPFCTVEEYTAVVRRYGVEFPENFGWLMARLREIKAAFARDPYTPHTCHNDLLNENFLDDGNIRIIDWEYAGIGDVAFDLANFAVHHQFNDEQDEFLLESYYSPLPMGEGLGVRAARHKLMKIASDLREAMWGMVQIGISKLDVDFRSYADKHFKRAEEMMRDARYGKWLAEFR